jgi:hypothetical protein
MSGSVRHRAEPGPIPAVMSHGHQWKALYQRRTAGERGFGRLQHEWAMILVDFANRLAYSGGSARAGGGAHRVPSKVSWITSPAAVRASRIASAAA